MNKILITGATGLIGQELVKQAHAKGYTVHYLTTRKSQIQNASNYKGFYWNPSAKEIDINCFEGVDAIINLAGASVAKRWTKAHKKLVLESRVDALQLLYSTIKENDLKIKQLVSASAIGIYPDSQTHFYEEDYQEVSTSFLGKVVKAWEDEALKFNELNINVSLIRVGIVLSNKGGALLQLVKPINNFVGASLGKGKQWQSWIHLEDIASQFLFVLENQLQGIYNGVAPNAIKQHELVKAIAKTLAKPLWLPNVPAFVMKLLLGDMSAIALESQRVSSKKIESLGFNYKHHHLQTALEEEL